MNFVMFRDIFIGKGVATSQEIAALPGTFDKNNLTRWCREGYLLRLRNGIYTFPELLSHPEFVYFLANVLYENSYVSLHAALYFHGLLAPQLNAQVDSVTSLKTTAFRNPIARFTYQTIKPQLLFGAQLIETGKFPYVIASAEKALLDLFYLYPTYYDTEKKIRNFAIEEQTLYQDFNLNQLEGYLELFENKSLEQRISLFRKVYGL